MADYVGFLSLPVVYPSDNRPADAAPVEPHRGVHVDRILETKRTFPVIPAEKTVVYTG